MDAETLYYGGIITTGTYTLTSSIANYKLIEIITQYGTTNWMSVRTYRSSLLASFPQVADSINSEVYTASYDMYIKDATVNVSSLTTNTRILIRGFK